MLISLFLIYFHKKKTQPHKHAHPNTHTFHGSAEALEAKYKLFHT